MSDEANEAEAEDLGEIVLSDSEHALATYASHTAELAQAFGNLLSQCARLPATHWLAPVAMTMLEKVAANVEVNQKGSLRAVKGGKE
jgi:hypothetical protein